MNLPWVHLGISLGLSVGLSATAQVPPQPVHWAAALVPEPVAKPGEKAVIEVSGEIDDGWHVYGLEQPVGGPTRLSVALGDNRLLEPAGAVSGSAPARQHDPSFDLDTQTYSHAFALHVPVSIKAHLPAGKQLAEVNVRFQACSDRLCLPPRTVHLSVPIEILAGH